MTEISTESILTSIKKLIGLTEEDTSFDTDVIMHINSVFSTLTQLGVGPPEGFLISDKITTWGDYLTDNLRLYFVKTYMYLKVKLLFDPPLTASVIDAMNANIKEYEWRLNVAVETTALGGEEV